MNINTFLENSVGEWFSQRSTYNIVNNDVDNSKANLTLNLLPPTDADIVSLSQEYNLNPELSLGSIAQRHFVIESKWDNSPDWGKPKQQGDSLMVIFRDDDEDNQGKFLRVVKNKETLMGKYVLAEDESLTFIIEKDGHYIEERICFASENLRLRNTIIKYDEKVVQTSFYSEIRKIINN
ncbi:phycobiliprotein lyase [Geminocystis herdmanii]|uniref:phycobiliprotein lyase n=1 Tax=Geminocystis herdmanii TaxID=669359 RepID=UPI0003451FAD|nr:phycobiliprotein lyase [Geminocystis herdmanii]